MSGTVAQINSLLNTAGTSTVSYIDNTDTPGASTTLTLSVNDNGNTGTGGSLIASDTATINITAVNDRPAVQNPIPDQTLNEDTPWTFTVPANTFVDPEGSSLTFAAALALPATTMRHCRIGYTLIRQRVRSRERPRQMPMARSHSKLWPAMAV